MSNEKTEPSLMEKVELMRTLMDLMKSGAGSKVYGLAEKKLIKLLEDL